MGDDALLHDIDDALRDTGLPAEVLELEITENVALDFEDAAVLQEASATAASSSRSTISAPAMRR